MVVSSLNLVFDMGHGGSTFTSPSTIIDYVTEDDDVTAEDREGILLALGKRHSLVRICLWMLCSMLQKFIITIDE